MELKDLRQLGLTEGELKIYEALLDSGETTRTALAKRSGVSPSKIYDVANRLLEKGVISVVKKNGVQHFRAANPERLFDLLERKEQELKKEREIVEQLIPQLASRYKEIQEITDVEVFYGWEGMRTVFDDLVKSLKKGDWNYIYGASKGYDSEQADIFFNQYYKKKVKKGYATKIIFNEELRKNPKRTRLFSETPNEMKFLNQETFAEINTYKDMVLFILLLKQPIVIRIKSAEAADSCRKFFDLLWSIAKK